MSILADINLSRNDYGYELVFVLGQGWREAAREFAGRRLVLEDILKPELEIAQKILQNSGLNQNIELTGGGHGLQRINITPNRMGLALFPDQNMYLSHNFSSATHVATGYPIMMRYFLDLEKMSPRS